MISPDGFAIRPRMPASCFICCWLPRAPEFAIMKIEFSSCTRPVSGSIFGCEISVIISMPT